MGLATDEPASDGSATGRAEDSSAPRLDDVDRRILGLLVADARLSARAVAREIGMSPGAITERVGRLEATGVVTGYHARLNPSAVGRASQIVIGVQVMRDLPSTDVIADLMGLPEVTTVHVVSGSWDLLVLARARDLSQLHHLLTDVIREIKGVARTETMLVMDTVEKAPAELLE